MGPVSLPASPPFESGPVLRYDAHYDGPDHGHDLDGAPRPYYQQQPPQPVPSPSPRIFPRRGSPRSTRDGACMPVPVPVW